jgi:hypothetical protein
MIRLLLMSCLQKQKSKSSSVASTFQRPSPQMNLLIKNPGTGIVQHKA